MEKSQVTGIESDVESRQPSDCFQQAVHENPEQIKFYG